MNVIPRRAFAVLFILPALLTHTVFGEENRIKKPEPFFTWDLLWTGSWYKSFKIPDEDLTPGEILFSGGTLYNRGDLSLAFPRIGLSFRFLATDKRLLPITENDGKSGFNPGAGIYHTGSGSRFIYGVQSEYGLPARIKNIWLRSIPFMESRSPSSRDLKTEPSAQDKGESYLYLALPSSLWPGFDAFASAAIDGELNTAFGSGIGYGNKTLSFRLEGFYSGKELPAKSPSTWFSSSPSLPERDSDIYALSLFFNTLPVGFAADWAFSETFAWGRGNYGNFSLRLGNKPWRFSIGGDAAGSRFTDRNGAAPGHGARFAVKAERFWPRSGLLRFQSTLRSPSLEEAPGFNRGNFSVYYRPSAPTAAQKRSARFPFRFTRASISINRDARTPEKTADSLDALAGFTLGPFSSVFTFSFDYLSCIDEGNSSPLFASPFLETFDSFKVTGELSIKPYLFDIRFRLGYTVRAQKDPLWEPSLNVSVRPGKWGRLGLKIASTDFPEKWNYTFSWRFETRR